MCCHTMLQPKRQLLWTATAGTQLHECCVLLGDFNARDGSRTTDDEWWHEGSPHGVGVLEAGKKCLSFLSINGTIICNNTWFQKKNPT